MVKKPYIYLQLTILLLSSITYGQGNISIKNGSIFWLNDGSKIIGKVIESDESTKKVAIITGDTVYIPSNLTKKTYLSDEISLFNNSKFHYKKGYLFNMSFGFANNHFNSDMSINKRLNNKLEVGLGVGFHYNSLTFRSQIGWHFIDVPSIPFFIQSKYFLNEGKRLIYLKGKVGYVNNYSSWGIESVHNSIMLEGSFGVLFSSHKKFKHYLELSQYSSNAYGKLRSFGFNDISEISFNTWFNRVVVTYGVEIGR